MPIGPSRLRNVILIMIVIACFGYAAYSIRKATRVPPASNRDEVRLVCTACWKESVMTTAECEAATDEKTDLTRCPHCQEFKASSVSLYCPQCQRAIPRSMVVFGTPYVCPFCKASLASGRQESD